MTKWLVEYLPQVNTDLRHAEAGREIPCFRIYPEGEPERWIAQTNPALPPEVQQEMALQIAQDLSNLLGI